MITHLISTTEFIKLVNSLETKQCDCAEEFDAKIAENYGKIIRYANFISQKPELWMFVPVDEEGNVIEKPDFFSGNYDDNGIDGEVDKYQYHLDLKQYQQAHSEVLFEGWHQIGRLGIGYNKNTDAINDIREWDTIEDLLIVGYELELTETALKQIGL